MSGFHGYKIRVCFHWWCKGCRRATERLAEGEGLFGLDGVSRTKQELDLRSFLLLELEADKGVDKLLVRVNLAWRSVMAQYRPSFGPLIRKSLATSRLFKGAPEMVVRL